MESRKLGNIYGFDGGNYAGNVYEKNDIAPTLTNMQGGNRQPMIIDDTQGFEDEPRIYGNISPCLRSTRSGLKVIDEVKELGFMDNGTGKHQSNTVVDENGLAPTITTVNGGGTQQIKVLTENVIIGGEQKHQAIKKDGVCTTLTSSMGTGGGYVPMVLTENIPCTTSKAINGKFLSTDELSLNNIHKTEANTITAHYCKGIERDNANAVIVAMRGRNPENPSDRTIGAPTEQRLEPNSQGICNTLTSVTKDNLVMEVKAIDEQNMCVRDETFGTLTTDGSSPKHNNRVMECVETQCRIRKLTPRECYRLMAVPEKDIDKMLEVNSNTQCYKQAGNSIVVNCLIAIFSQMGIQGIPRWNEGLSEKYK